MFRISPVRQISRINVATTIFVHITDIMILRRRNKMGKKRREKTKMEIAR